MSEQNVIAIQREKLKEEYGVSDAYLTTLLSLVKQRLGIMSDVRDTYLEPRALASLYALLKEKAVRIDYDDTNHLLFLVDYTAWEYQSIGNPSSMPAHLRYRLNDLLIQAKGARP